jgi:hypothetical protein
MVGFASDTLHYISEVKIIHPRINTLYAFRIDNLID